MGSKLTENMFFLFLEQYQDFFKGCQDFLKTPKSHFVRIFVPPHFISIFKQ